MDKNRIKNFISQWKDRGRERSESQPFWLALLRDVYGIEQPEEYIRFEESVQLGHKSFIDGFIDATHVIIEQKSLDKDLNEPIKQSDGTFLTPYQQAKRYAAELPYSKRPRWIIACNFKEFHVYDLETPQAKPEIILLENLDHEYYRLNFLIDNRDENIKRELELSIKAGEIVGKIYDAIHKQYINPDSDESLKSLNKLCVRLVFCLYAESAGIFGKRNMFRDYLQTFREENIRRALIELFKVLNIPTENRDPYIEDKLAAFPYVNGGLFNEDNIEIPKLTTEIIDLLIHQASENFDWSGISPTIFGAVFESTLNPLTRRSGGMHYTSIENIHKVIDPLFLDDLKSEFEKCRGNKKKLLAFQKKLSELKFLDPACGSGNFLTETYLSLRRLENKVLKELIGAQITLGDLNNPIKVSISQFYGIEINDFAVTVAKTALWIAESQMMAETAEIVHRDLDFLPLKTYTNIEEGNALQIDWQSVAPQVDYIIGNPPFVGKSYQTKLQKSDMAEVFKGVKNFGNLDYVACWYKKAADFIKNTSIKVAFVSTNSICQGIAVPPLWKYLFNNGIKINFAHSSFIWNSESNSQAHVHCVIVGFSEIDNRPKLIFNNDRVTEAENINAYLLDAPNIIVEGRNKPFADVPPMIVGSCPTDGGGFIIEADEYEDFIKREPAAVKFIRPYIGSEEFINNKKRYCLWLKDADPAELRKMPLIMKRIEAVKEFRLSSKKEQTRRRAQTPTLFAEDRYIEADSIFMPMVSSERRQYVPIGFVDSKTIMNNKSLFIPIRSSCNRKYIPFGHVDKNVIVSNLASFIPNTDNFLFGVLISSVHMAWMRAIAGRLKSDYSYSATIVYNTFPFCTPTENQRQKIELTAQGILNARVLYPNSSLADLYDERTMPPELRKAHQANDKAVMKAYGFDLKMTETEIVAELMKMYAAFAQ